MHLPLNVRVKRWRSAASVGAPGRARRFAQSQACVELQWQTPARNHTAIHFYDRLGAAGVAKQRYTWPLPRH